MLSLPDAILVPVAGHLMWLLFLFGAVSLKRMQAVKINKIEIDDLAHKEREPEISRRWANNLNNQFEVPVLFYGIIALLYATDMVTQTHVFLAWIFLLGRLAHSYVQISGDNVRLRGQVFVINFLAVYAMWALFFLARLGDA
ncbi:MAG: MAPEG family protein [Pseudomonadota bacterium]